MRRLFPLFSYMLAMCSFVACQSDDVDPNNPPVLEIDTDNLNIDGSGGDIPIYYAVTNGTKGTRPEVTSNDEWITVKEITSYTIVLSIAENKSAEERSGIVSISYKGMKSKLRVFITQDQRSLNMFKFEVSDVTYKRCTVRYIPADNEMQYMANIIDKEFFSKSGINTEELFIAAEMKNYLDIAAANDMTLEELMSRVQPQLIYKGEALRLFDGMQHGSSYVVYSYGVEFNENEYTLTTPIHYTIVELPMPQMYPVSFDISASVTGSLANVTIKPNEWDGYYNIQLIPDSSLYYVKKGEAPTDYIVKMWANDFYRRGLLAMTQGATAESFLSGRCYKGEQKLSFPLGNENRYMLVVFAVASEDGAVPVIRSKPSLAHLKGGSIN